VIAEPLEELPTKVKLRNRHTFFIAPYGPEEIIDENANRFIDIVIPKKYSTVIHHWYA